MKNKYFIIIGNGSFVCKDNFGPGVILRSLLQYVQETKQNNIALFYRSEEKRLYLEEKIASLDAKSDVSLHSIHTLDQFIQEENITAAFISVPDNVHFFYAKKFLLSHIATWLVKPITDNLSQAQELAILSKQHNTPLWIDFHKRFDHANRLAYMNIQQQKYGKLLHYSVQYTQPLTLPRDTFSWSEQTNVFSYIGCHYVDLLEFFYPQKIASFKISALGTKGTLYKEKGLHDTIIATIHLQLHSEETIIASFQVGWNDPEGTPSKSHQRLELTFEKGRFILDQKERGFEIWDNTKTHQVNPYFFIQSYDPMTNAYKYSGYGYDSILNFLHHIEKREKSITIPLIHNTLFSEYVLKALKESLINNGKWIEEQL